MIVVWIVAALVVLSIAKDIAIKVSVESGVRIVTGLKLSMHNFNAGIVRQVVSIRGLKLYNPEGFKDKVMLDMPEIYVDYDLPAIFSGTIHLKEARLDMRELVVVKNEKGELNLNSLNVVKQGKAGGGAEGQKGKAPNIRIDKLRLKIGRAVYKDYSKGGEPSVKEFNINIDETYNNIDNPNALVGLIVVRSLANTSISSMANFDIGGLQSSVTNTLATAGRVAGHATTAAQESVKAVSKTAAELQNVFKNPFGGK